jgi:hypothetical protein
MGERKRRRPSDGYAQTKRCYSCFRKLAEARKKTLDAQK